MVERLVAEAVEGIVVGIVFDGLVTVTVFD
jgi:hypothetical protein